MYRLYVIKRLKFLARLKGVVKAAGCIFFIFENFYLLYSDFLLFLNFLKGFKLCFLVVTKKNFMFSKVLLPLFMSNSFLCLYYNLNKWLIRLDFFEFLLFNKDINFINVKHKKFKKFGLFNLRFKFLFVIYNSLVISLLYFRKLLLLFLGYPNGILCFFFLKILKKFVNFNNVYIKSNL